MMFSLYIAPSNSRFGVQLKQKIGRKQWHCGYHEITDKVTFAENLNAVKHKYFLNSSMNFVSGKAT